MKKLVRVIWKLILTFDGIVFCSSVGATIWFSLLKKFPLIDLSASTSKVICHYLFILFMITIVLNVLLACIMIAVDLWSKSDVSFEQGGLIVGTAKSEQIPFTKRNKSLNPSKPTPTDGWEKKNAFVGSSKLLHALVYSDDRLKVEHFI